MTRLLEKAIEEVHKLPNDEQDIIASIILEEILAEKQWQTAFAQSQDQLSKLAEQARGEVRAGRFVKMSFDEL
ncbi:MAG: hypothetical protein AB1641_19565 [Thermodesulfobacteriota bacterium]